jgi:uncharacterized protein (TIGR02246 family)
MRYAVAGVVLGAVLVVACAQQPPAPPPKPDEAAIRAALEPRLAAITQVLTKRDASAVPTIFTDDGVWILPDASTFKGKDAIQKGAAAFFTSFDSVSNMSQAIDKIVVVSDSEAVTFTTGKYTIFMKGKKGEAHINPYVDDWKKGSDGTWRIAYEVNADGPANPPAPAPASGKKS